MGAAKSSKKRRRWLRRLVVFVLVGGVLGFFGSNLVIGSSWGRGKIAAKLSGVSGFNWSVGRASWSPWGGVRVGGLEMTISGTNGAEMPAILTVDEVRVRPYWGELLGGDLALREAVVLNPVGEVPLELLAAMTPVQSSVQVPVMVVREAEVASEVESVEDSEEVVKPVAEKPRNSSEGKEETPEESVAKRKEPDVGLPGRVVVRGGRLRVFSLAAPQWSLELLGFDGEVPLAGPEDLGWVSLDEVRVGGETLLGGIWSEVAWKRPALAFSEMEITVGGVPVRVGGGLLMGRRPRAAVQITVPPSEFGAVGLPGMAELKVAGQRVQVAGSFQGELLRPSSWRGNMVAEGAGLSVDALGRVLVGFELGRVAVNFQGGVLQLVDGRLVGEQFSMLGNGGIRWDGQMLGVVRLVGDWEHADMLRQVAGGALLWNKDGWMMPLGCPDRLYRDLHVEGPLREAKVDLGRGEDGMKLAQAWDQLQRFTAGEQLEEELGVPPSPDGGPVLLQR